MMPVNRKSNLEELLKSLQYWYQKTGKSITFEYVVWKGINDKKKDIDALVDYCRKVPSKVNLIEYNVIEDSEFRQADAKAIEYYVRELERNHITVNVRRSRGKDIDAACGQLANKSS
jgi:23S rRNA (adenine2503-C2)-methyltransferase